MTMTTNDESIAKLKSHVERAKSLFR